MMSPKVLLTVTSLLSILLVSIHVSDDIVRGFDKWRFEKLSFALLLVVRDAHAGRTAVRARDHAPRRTPGGDHARRPHDYHLASARATATAHAAPGLRCPVRPSVEGLVRTMRRLHADRELTIEIHVSSTDEIRGPREDLEEMLGNLLDNACKWARSRVGITSVAGDDGRVSISIHDDGPGLEPSMRARVLQRGVRADVQVRGSGLGLAPLASSRSCTADPSRWRAHSSAERAHGSSFHGSNGSRLP
jgi:hypothetical protein